MENTQTFIDSQTWSVIAHNAILVYTEDEPDEDVWESIANELELGYRRDDTISYDTVCTVAALVNPDTRTDDAELGRFAWILDEAVECFLPKSA